MSYAHGRKSKRRLNVGRRPSVFDDYPNQRPDRKKRQTESMQTLDRKALTRVAGNSRVTALNVKAFVGKCTRYGKHHMRTALIAERILRERQCRKPS